MDCVSSLRSYLESILLAVSDTKVLLLDDETTNIISLVYTQSELLRHDVVLVEPLATRVDSQPDTALEQLQCLCILRPTPDNIRIICHELNRPHFGSYFIFFTNTVESVDITQIAYSDHFSRISALQEIYADYYCINKHMFTLNIRSSIRELGYNRENQIMKRIVDGLFSVFASNAIKPCIRFDANSTICRNIAQNLSNTFQNNQELMQSVSKSCTLLLMDRRSDPITPLLHGWSYITMINEFTNMQNNVAVLPSNKKSMVLDPRSDSFFASHIFTNFGEIGQAVNDLTKMAQSQSTDVRNINDIEALKSFIQSYPKYKERSALAEKHVSLLTEITNIIRAQGLMKLSPLEQSIATENNLSEHFQEVKQAIESSETSLHNCVRLFLLFCLRYQGSDKIAELASLLDSRGYNGPSLDDFYDFCGGKSQSLFSTKSIVNKAKSLLGMAGNENRFILYTPFLSSILQRLEKQTLERDLYPFINESMSNPSLKQTVVIFYVGGVTFEEARIAHEASQSGGLDVILGGTTVHNFNSFLYEEIKRK